MSNTPAQPTISYTFSPGSDTLGAGVTISTEQNSRGTNVTITVRSHATEEDADNALHIYRRTLVGIETIRSLTVDELKQQGESA